MAPGKPRIIPGSGRSFQRQQGFSAHVCHDDMQNSVGPSEGFYQVAQRTRAGCHISRLSTALPISWSGGGCGRYLHSYSRTVGPQRCIYYQERVPQYFYVSMPLQQPGSYQGGEMMMMKAVIWWRKPEYPEETTDILFSLDIPAGLIFMCRQTSTHPHCPVVSTIH